MVKGPPELGHWNMITMVYSNDNVVISVLSIDFEPLIPI